jgi:hypothetical protein
VFLSKDQQTIALRQAFGISEIRVQDALNPSPAVSAQRTGDAAQTLTEAPQVAAAYR